MAEPLDLVYTWVDDSFPGYLDLRERYAATRHDRNPNRTRDNLEILRYSLRSLAYLAAPLRRVYLVTCRPQVPHWLDPDAPGLRLVHHDEFMEPAELPTFNSFAIVASLAELPGLSQQFLYLEDDHLFGRWTTLADFVDPDGRLRLWTKAEPSPGAERRADVDASPWNLAVARCNHLLDQRYRPEPRRAVRHGPKLIDIRLWRRMIAAWPEELVRTRASRFRAAGNVAPEYLYPYFAWYEGRARRVPIAESYWDAYYQGIDNVLLQQWLQLRFLRLLRPKFYCLNDNFDEQPDPRVVGWLRRYLDETYPCPSRFERM